jgi:hypothetical protein
MNYFLNQKSKGHVYVSRRKCIPKTQVIGIFSSKTRIPSDYKNEVLLNYKAWILTEDWKVVTVKRSSRYLLINK